MSYPYFGQNGQAPAPNQQMPPMPQAQSVPPNQSAPSFLQNPNFQNVPMGQSLFPQPTGSVYNLGTASDIGNVPAGIGISVGLCLQENVMYIKALQNGSPMLLGYKLSPLEGTPNAQAPEPVVNSEETEALVRENKKLVEILKGHEDKILMIESQLAKIKDKVGGKSEWQL